MTAPDLRTVGKNVHRVDAYDKVTGGRGFPVNVVLPGMLHAKLLRSPYAHARIVKIDASEAERLPGVRAVLIPDEVPKRKYHPVFFVPTLAASVVKDMLVMSSDVRFAGQPVAAVAATTPEIAERALELIDVEYEELPAVFDPTEAMNDCPVKLHEHAPDNIALRPTFEQGDIEAGFAEADYIYEGTYKTQRVHTCYMEPRVCVVDTDPLNNIVVHSSMQHMFGLREKLAFILDIPVGQVRVVKPAYIGGGFGGKLDIGYIEPIAALLSMKTRKPVRIEQTRAEDFITTARHPIEVYLKTGIKKDGTFIARYARSIMDTGAHATHSSIVIMVHGMFGIMATYKSPNKKWDGYVVYTNNMVGGGYRGYGAPQAAFAVEQQIDEICEDRGFDPVEFRLKNSYQEGGPHPLFDCNLTTYRFEECLRRGAEKIGWHRRKPAAMDKGTKKRGIGLACQPIWAAGCLGQPDIYEHSGAIIKLNPDGSADLATACIDLGGGQNTVFCQIAAEELGLPVEKVRLSACDTGNVPFDAPTHASRATYCAGGAIMEAARDAKRKLLKLAAILLDEDADNLAVRDERIFVKGRPDTGVAIADVASHADSPLVVVTDDGPRPTKLSERGTIIGVSSMRPPASPSPAAAEFVEVEVDTETGKIDVLSVVYAHDIGRIINPAGAEGQVEGGFQQGMGYALMEHLQFDPDTGACVSGDFLDYKMPTAVEMPPRIESIFIESNEPTGPFGAKSLSEPAIIVPAAAIANAVYNAVGVRFRELPITPEKVLAGLGGL